METAITGIVYGAITGIMLIVGWIVFVAPKHIYRDRDPKKGEPDDEDL